MLSRVTGSSPLALLSERLARLVPPLLCQGSEEVWRHSINSFPVTLCSGWSNNSRAATGAAAARDAAPPGCCDGAARDGAARDGGAARNGGAAREYRR